ncbi:CD59 glycoprotein-like [Engraulis encrasicolus]|uniref:CD59 glycoprotein-like n=1 Tax=Engraulis encrasicolus TaxID=184585 RepID=UPI002FD39E04
MSSLFAVMAGKISLIVLLLATMMATADSLRCYLGANGQYDKTTCVAPYDTCIKAVREGKSVVKSCTVKSVCDVELPGTKHYCCDTDLCNGAGTVGKNLLLLLVPLASIFVLS